MADDVIKIIGLLEVQKSLYSYSQKLGDFVVKKALREGAIIVRNEIKARAPVYKGKPKPQVKIGTLKKGFKVSASKIHAGKMSTDLIGVYVGLKKGKGRKDLNDPFYGKFIAGGFRTKKADPFVEEAFNAKKEIAVDVIVRSATAGAEVLAKKEGF